MLWCERNRRCQFAAGTAVASYIASVGRNNTMTTQIAMLLGLLFVALILFATERIPIEIVSILLVIALVLTNTLTPTEALPVLATTS